MNLLHGRKPSDAMNAPPHLTLALEDLARDRREIASAIMTIARVAGVDPTPYLDAGVVSAPPLETEPTPRAKAETPPRPRQPASPATNGTGRAHTVTDESPARILAALQAHGQPMAPRELAKALGMEWSTAKYHVRKLAAANQVVLSGTTSTRRISLV